MRAPERLLLEPISVSELPISEAYGQAKARHFRARLASGEFVYFGFTAGIEWIDVYARRRRAGEKEGRFTGPYACYGFSRSSQRWSFGSGPPGAAEIRVLVAALISLASTPASHTDHRVF
jgi:hypothetical protein